MGTTTERTLTASAAGATTLELTLPHGRVEVTVGEARHAEVTLSAHTGDEPAEKALAAASMTTGRSGPTVAVPDTYTSGGGTGGVFIGGASTSIITGGTVVINGKSSGVTARVRLPRGSALTVRTVSADVTTSGPLEGVEFASTSGSLRADACGRLRARTVSGDIAARAVAGPADASTTSGDIDLADLAGPTEAHTVSGDVVAHLTTAYASVRASSTSGDVTVTASICLPSGAVDACSVSGRVRAPR